MHTKSIKNLYLFVSLALFSSISFGMDGGPFIFDRPNPDIQIRLTPSLLQTGRFKLVASYFLHRLFQSIFL